MSAMGPHIRESQLRFCAIPRMADGLQYLRFEPMMLIPTLASGHDGPNHPSEPWPGPEPIPTEPPPTDPFPPEPEPHAPPPSTPDRRP